MMPSTNSIDSWQTKKTEKDSYKGIETEEWWRWRTKNRIEVWKDKTTERRTDMIEQSVRRISTSVSV